MENGILEFMKKNKLRLIAFYLIVFGSFIDENVFGLSIIFAVMMLIIRGRDNGKSVYDGQVYEHSPQVLNITAIDTFLACSSFFAVCFLLAKII